MASDTELAWAAGFFDGEGCFMASPGGPVTVGAETFRRRYLRVSVTQKNDALLHKFASIMGFGYVRGYPARATSSAGSVYYCGSRQALRAASAMWPWLGEQKKADFKRCLRLVKETRERAAQVVIPARVCAAEDCGRTFTPDIRHKDADFCSRRCRERIVARVRRGPPPERYCKGCGCHTDERTYACRRCMTRHWQRRQKQLTEEACHHRKIP